MQIMGMLHKFHVRNDQKARLMDEHHSSGVSFIPSRFANKFRTLRKLRPSLPFVRKVRFAPIRPRKKCPCGYNRSLNLSCPGKVGHCSNLIIQDLRAVTPIVSNIVKVDIFKINELQKKPF